MKTKSLLSLLLVVFQFEVGNSQIPNSSFEYWTNVPLLVDWQTNSCPWCVPPWEDYIIQQDSTDVYSGNYAAKFVYNDTFPVFAKTKFALSLHPLSLTAYVKNQLTGNDTAYIGIKLFNNNAVVDSGGWMNITAIPSYTQLIIPISQNALQMDSAEVTIIFGNEINTFFPLPFFWVDNLSLDFPNGIENVNSNDNLVSVFPNPVNNMLTIQNNSFKDYRFALYNSLGAVITDQTLTNKTSTINLSNDENAIYFYKVTHEGKLIKSGIIIKQ